MEAAAPQVGRAKDAGESLSGAHGAPPVGRTSGGRAAREVRREGLHGVAASHAFFMRFVSHASARRMAVPIAAGRSRSCRGRTADVNKKRGSNANAPAWAWRAHSQAASGPPLARRHRAAAGRRRRVRISRRRRSCDARPAFPASDSRPRGTCRESRDWCRNTLASSWRAASTAVRTAAGLPA